MASSFVARSLIALKHKNFATFGGFVRLMFVVRQGQVIAINNVLTKTNRRFS
jgi:hypothetical protein